MSTLAVKDATGATTYLKGTGAASSGDPFIAEHSTTLLASSALVGKVKFDVTTPGTTNSVAIITGQDGVAGGAGVVGATVLRVALATNANVVDTELPAAAALSDVNANPTTPIVGAASLVHNGTTFERERVANVFKFFEGVSLASIATIWTPAGGKKIRLMGGTISSSAAVSYVLEDNSHSSTTNYVFVTPKLEVDKPYNLNLGQGILLGTADHVLKGTGAGAITGTLWGTEE